MSVFKNRLLQKAVFLISCFALFTLFFVPFANVKAAESYNNSIKIERLSHKEQKELDELTKIMIQCLVKDGNGVYNFDEEKARELGLSEKQIDEANNLFTNVLSQQDIRDMVGDNNNNNIVPYGKISMSAKELAKLLKKYAKSIDKAIDKCIDLLPVSHATKKKLKTYISALALAKVLDNFVGVSDTVEDLATRGIEKLIPGIPHWLAKGIAKTLMMALPI